MFPTSYGMNTQEIKTFLSQPKKVALAVFFVFLAIFLVLVLSSGVNGRSSFSLNSVSAPMMGAIPSSYGKGGYGGYAVTENAYAPQIGQEAGQVVRTTGTGVVISPDRKVIQSASLSIVENKAREAGGQIKNIAEK